MNKIIIERDNGVTITSTPPSNTAIARGINEIMDYLENDLKEDIKEMAVREINNRFEILDL